MTHLYTIVEPTTALRDWHRTLTQLTNLVGQRIYAEGLATNPVYPAIVLHRQGGTLDGAVDNGVYRYDVWGTRISTVATISGTLVSLLKSTGPTLIDPTHGVWFMGAEPGSPAYFPDPDVSGIHRHVVQTQVTTLTKP